MYTIKNKFSGIIRTLSLVVVCLFTINTLAWACPTEDAYPKQYDLAVQSIFKPIADAGVEVSAKMQFEILAGAMLLLSGRSAAATNAYLAETYIKSKSTETRKIDFLEIRDRDRGLPATFKIVGKDDLVFELDFQGTLTGDKGMNRVPRKPKLPADISGKVMKYANFLNDNGILLIRELTRSKDEREVPRPQISDVEPPEKGAVITYTANTFSWRTIHTADWEPRGFVAILKRLLKDAPGIIRARILGVIPTYAISRTLPKYDAMAFQMYDTTPELNRGISGLIESYISKNRSENKTTTYLDACGGLGCAATEVSVRYGRDGARVYMTDIVGWTADDISAGDARNIRQEGAKRGIEDILSRQFEFIKADVVSVSLPEKMDVITNIAGLQYTDDPLQTIVNLYNQLKIGGTLLTGYWVRQENKSALEHFYITLEAIARLGSKVDVKTTYLEGEGAYIIGIAITRNDDRDIKLNLIPVEVKNLEALDKVRDLFQKVVYYKADGSGSAISIKEPSQSATAGDQAYVVSPEIMSSRHFAGNDDLEFISEEELDIPRVSVWRALKHSIYLREYGENALKTPLMVSDHLILAGLCVLMLIYCIIGVPPSLIFHGYCIGALCVLGGIAYLDMARLHAKDVRDGYVVYKIASQYLKNKSNPKLDLQLLEIVEEFEQKTGWGVAWTENPHLLVKADRANRRVILNIGWILESDIYNSGRRLKYLPHMLHIMERAIKRARMTNVTCGTICQAGHEGSYQALDEQLSRKFAEYKALLGITEDRDLTEAEVDAVLHRQGYMQDPNQLDQIRKWVRQQGSIPDNISIFFGVPENGKKLWYVGEDYAGGHFNQAGTRIHISLPLILAERNPAKAALAVARHDYQHIRAILHGEQPPAHDEQDEGMKIVARVSQDKTALSSGQIIQKKGAPHLSEFTDLRLFYVSSGRVSLVLTGSIGGEVYYIKVPDLSGVELINREIDVLKEVYGYTELQEHLSPSFRYGVLNQTDVAFIKKMAVNYVSNIGANYIVTKKMPGVSIEEDLERIKRAVGRTSSAKSKKKLEGEVVNTLQMIHKALVDLHARGVCHRDLGPSEIFTDGSNIRFCDFGQSVTLP